MRSRVAAIVPSAGQGKRLGLKVKKPFVSLGGKPLIAHALETLDKCRIIDGIVIAAECSCIKDFEDLADKFKFKKIINIIVGGKTRYESVRNCLETLDSSFDIILIHDGVRPFVEKSMIEHSVNLARKFGACIVAVPEIDTVKSVDSNLFVRKTLDRNQVFRAQTPQVFRRDLIEKAYAVRGKGKITDDASLVEILGKKIKILEGSYRNIKITTKEDLKFAEALL